MSAALPTSTNPTGPNYFNILSQMNALAKEDFNAFCERVMKDERSGKYVEQAPIHQAWAEQVEQYDKLILWSAVEHGKTTQMSIARPLYELGRNPNLRIAVVSATHDQSRKITRSIKRYIERSQDYHAVFPHIAPDEPWQDTRITVKRPNDGTKDPSIQATGITGNILGSRVDLLILDDVLSWENTHTKEQREQIWQRYHSMLAGRLTEGGRVIVVGTAFHPEDLLHRLARENGFKPLRYPVEDEDGTPRWPERWSKQRIAKARTTMMPTEFDRQLMCVTRSNESGHFKEEWINSCLEAGFGKRGASGRDDEGFEAAKMPPGYRVFTGVDLAVQAKDSADLTALFTICVTPVAAGQKRTVMECISGRWKGPEITDRIAHCQRRWGSIVIVENNAAQAYIQQELERRGVTCHGFTTGRNKAHPEFGIESMAAEMRAQQWVIPSPDGQHAATPEIEEWIREMKYYDPASHTGDRLMASWFAREGIRMWDKNKAYSLRVDIRSR